MGFQDRKFRTAKAEIERANQFIQSIWATTGGTVTTSEKVDMTEPDLNESIQDFTRKLIDQAKLIGENPTSDRLTLDEYQRRTQDTAVYPGKGSTLGLYYTALGLGEAGEVQGKVKKIIRDDNSVLTDEKKTAIAKELGDILWYCAALACELGLSLGEIAEANLSKLASRKERGAIQGSGDDR